MCVHVWLYVYIHSVCPVYTCLFCTDPFPHMYTTHIFFFHLLYFACLWRCFHYLYADVDYTFLYCETVKGIFNLFLRIPCRTVTEVRELRVTGFHLCQQRILFCFLCSCFKHKVRINDTFDVRELYKWCLRLLLDMVTLEHGDMMKLTYQDNVECSFSVCLWVVSRTNGEVPVVSECSNKPNHHTP